MFDFMKVMKKFLFILLLALLIFPEFQAQFLIIKSKPLSGVAVNTPPPLLTGHSWLDGSYQKQCTRHYDDSIGLKSDLVRLCNQIDFSLFNVSHAKNILSGKDNYLFDVDYLHAAAGKDFAGTAMINSRVKDLKKLQDFLWNRYRIFFLVILCPDKPAFYPEYIPEPYHSSNRKITNAAYVAKRCIEEGVNVIDFNPWFLSMKKNSLFPLIPKTGIHWSYYGAYLAADSMARYLRVKTNFPVPELILDSITKPELPIAEDNDMGATLNLIRDIPCPQTGFPRFHTANAGTPKPSALFIGDSFYWNWYNGGMISSLFTNNEFWYYCREVYPQSSQKSTSVSEIDTEEALKRQNFIILIQVNGAYGNPGYGFTEIARSALDPRNSKLARMERAILLNAPLLEDIKRKAVRNHIKFEEQLRLDAIWIIEHEKK